MAAQVGQWGLRPQPGGGAAGWVWAPGAQQVSLETETASVALSPDTCGGWRYSGDWPSRYRFNVDGRSVPDPASRLQDGDVHSATWPKHPLRPAKPGPAHDLADLAILEIHIGTFTQDGTFHAAADRLPAIAKLGLTAIEVMPIAQVSGAFGWGYDGVLPFAVHPAYGTREEFRDFVEAAHDAGLSVILDIVYNHFGPVGAYLHQICPEFFDKTRTTPWGPAIDYARPEVRAFFLQNAEMWLSEFGVDGFRIDAAHQIVDETDPHILVELAAHIRRIAGDRPLHLILEDERNPPDLRETGGYDAQWNDDYHHAIHCLLTGESAGYYASFAVDPLADLCRALAEGHVEQGQPRKGLTQPRGAPSDHLPPTGFVNANQTHDQIGNRARGERLITLAGAEAMRVAHALLLTSPAIPMLFMGEEIGARTPFQFFADYDGDMAETVREGRRAEFAAFDSFADQVPDPTDPATRDRSRPYDSPPPDADAWRDLTRRALAFRHAHTVPLVKSGRAGTPKVVQLGEAALYARWPFAAGTLETVARFMGMSDPVSGWPDPGLTFGDRAGGPFFATRVAR